MLALALLLFAGAAPAVQGEVAASAKLKGLVADGEPGLAVLVRSGGRTVLERAYGVRELRTRRSARQQRIESLVHGAPHVATKEEPDGGK